MGRRTTSTDTVIQEQSLSQKVAKDIYTANPMYVSDNTFDVLKYVETLHDVELKLEVLDDNVSGYIKKEGDKFVISINKAQTPLRQRFTLAHELGHYTIHKSQLTGQHTDISLFRDSNEDRLGIEYVANDFAAELLMPEDGFRNAIAEGENTPRQLSALFQVTEKAVLYRAYKLGISKSFHP